MAKTERNEFPDAVQAAPKTTKVLYENDKIRVIEEKFRKGQKVPMHHHPPYFAYFADRMKFKLTFPDGKTNLVTTKKGDWGLNEKGGTHAVENYLRGAILVVEIK